MSGLRARDLTRRQVPGCAAGPAGPVDPEAGSVSGSGGESLASSITQQSSVGQQLTDLDKAYQQGVVTEKEYLKLRKAIIRAND